MMLLWQGEQSCCDMFNINLSNDTIEQIVQLFYTNEKGNIYGCYFI